ncbi:lipopolysaccharide assembly protein LapA domain-containing protein [Planctobacterium marinum]|uniref:Lipopolysaccharide assembly protein A domain-containing protein n=1 Tax=Planctobacterium marinum TaxID=1631968 RepID=A0AA48HRH9_9ALTE|nr:hypothetical protein MACH26_21800 [Planctobacterium marinum]
MALCLVVLLLALIVGSQNTQLTDFNYLIAKAPISVSALLGGSVLVGALIASMFWAAYVIKLKFMLRSQNKQFVKSINKKN